MDTYANHGLRALVCVPDLCECSENRCFRHRTVLDQG